MIQRIVPSLPMLPAYYVCRPHLVSTVLSHLNGTINAVLLDGQPGLGATSFLSEVARTETNLVLTLFVNSASRIAYSPEYLADVLASQAESLESELSGNSQVVEVGGDEGQTTSTARLRRALIRLHRRASAARKHVLIVVDGLHQVPPEDKGYVDEVLKDVLPFGIPSFRFIITVGNSKLASTIGHSVEARLFTLVTLSPSECEVLCVKAGLESSNGEEIYGITKGHPGKVASAIRLLLAGKSISTLSGQELGDFFIQEWDSIPDRTSSLESALAYVTFSRRVVAIEDVISYSGCSRESIVALSGSEMFIKCSKENDAIELVGDAQKKFLEQRLGEKKTEIVRVLIGQLAENPKSDLALRFLPAYYETLNRSRDLIKFLDADTLEKYLESGQSVSELLRKVELGLNAANQAKELHDTLRFSLNVSFVRDADSSDVWAPRLSALVALGHFEEAYAVTQFPATREERLHLMSLYVKAAYDAKRKIDQAIVERINSICKTVDISALGDKAVDIAINLVGFFPDLALHLIEKTSGIEGSEKDHAYLRLGISSGLTSRDGRKDAGESKQCLSKIRDTSLQRFATAAEALVAGRSLDDFRSAIRHLNGRDKLYFIQRWLVVNCELDGAVALIDDALQALVEDTKYLPTALDLKEISSPLLHEKNREIAPEYIRRIDSHRGAISEKSPTLELLKLDIQLAKIECTIDRQLAADRLLKMSYDIMNQVDPGGQLEAYARLLGVVEVIDPDRMFESKEGFREIFSTGFDNTIDVVLAQTAQHFDVLKGALLAFSEFDPCRALMISARLNTEARRDSACLFVAKSVIRAGVRPVSVDFLLACVNQISDQDASAEALREICRQLSRVVPDLDRAPCELIVKCKAHHTGRLKADLLISAILINHKYKCNFETNSLIDDFHALVSSLDPVWQRRVLGYRMVAALQDVSQSLGQDYFDRFCEAEKSFGVASSNLAENQQYLVRLSIVAWASLLKQQKDSEEDLLRIRGLIGDIPSYDIQVRLYAELCERAWLKQRPDVLEQICQKWVIPLIETLRRDDRDIYSKAIARLFPSLYLWRQSLSLNLLNIISRTRRDSALTDAVIFLVTKRPMSEEFRDPKLRTVSVTYDQALLATDVIGHIETDAELGYCVEYITKAINSQKSRVRIADVQRVEIADKLASIINSKLPDLRNIKHEGWKLLCLARVELLKNQKTVDWEAYLNHAIQIPNCADRVLLLAELADIFPAKKRNLASRALLEAQTNLRAIPAAVDRISRAIGISQCSCEDAKLVAEGLLRQALLESLSYPDDEISSAARRDLLDVANQIDGEMAKRLVDLIDDDPARRSAKFESTRQIQLQDARKAIIEARADFNIKQNDNLAAACWDALGSLNAGKCATSKPADLASLIEQAARGRIGDSFPIFLWYLRNSEVRFELTNEAETTLKPQLEVLLMVSDLANRIVHRLCDDEYWPQARSGRGSENIFVSPSGREEAIEHICVWVEQMIGDEILICDPYFGSDDLELIKTIHFRRANLKYTVLISPDANTHGGDLKAAFQSAWRNISDAAPPPIRIVIVMFKGTHKGAIHDRWLLGPSSGLRVGTSVNGLGSSRWSEISSMDESSAGMVRDELLRFARLQEWFAGGVQVDYEVASVQ